MFRAFLIALEGHAVTTAVEGSAGSAGQVRDVKMNWASACLKMVAAGIPILAAVKGMCC
jgi:hypothetical protein